ncbi:MAG TPA: histidine phosphatase family protein [Candidatus Methylomirabilis sp.]|nr:histidine phosphatase family protein [Candidatus Methylomirabilis sp.]
MSSGESASPARVFLVALASLGLGLSVPVSAADTDALWGLLRQGGQVVVIRHAATDPGVGDPVGFRLDDCSSQRNLSAAGREEARRVGEAFRVRGIPFSRVLSSRWCRCLETGRLAFGKVEPWPPLDSFFNDRSREPEQTRAVRARVSRHSVSGNLILVTHGVNITALTGISPAQGEMVLLTPQGNGAFRVAGRLRPAIASAN